MAWVLWWRHGYSRGVAPSWWGGDDEAAVCVLCLCTSCAPASTIQPDPDPRQPGCCWRSGPGRSEHVTSQRWITSSAAPGSCARPALVHVYLFIYLFILVVFFYFSIYFSYIYIFYCSCYSRRSPCLHFISFIGFFLWKYQLKNPTVVRPFGPPVSFSSCDRTVVNNKQTTTAAAGWGRHGSAAVVTHHCSTKP